MDPETEAASVLPSVHEGQRVGVAEALLALPETEAELAWQQLPHESLLSEVSKYRESIRDIANRLRELGGDAGLPIGEEDLLLQGCATAGSHPPATTGPDDDPDDSELPQLGDDGVEYTLGNVDDVDPTEWQVPPHCVPIHANVTTFDWPSLYEHCQFDVVMMDPPWQLATANPTRGVALGYSQLTDDHIAGLPVPQLQRNGGFLFVWVINAKYKWTLDLFDKWGYRLVDEVVWVKMTVNRRLAKSHGYYLQHAKEVCLVAKCGNPPALAGSDGGVGSDIIFSERRGQSQKPEEIYELIEQLVPNGRYLEIFARKNNLRDYWVSIGNEVTGTGLPEEDMRALKELNCIPGAVYGKTGGGGGGGGGIGRSASAGSGPAAMEGTAVGPNGSGGAAAPSGRAASSGGTGAVAAGGGAARASSGATSSGAAQAGRARSAPVGVGPGSVSATAQPCPPLPPRPADVAAGQDVPLATTGSANQSQLKNPQLQHHYPPPQPVLHHHNQQQEGAARPPSRLSLTIRMPRKQQSRVEPSRVSEAGADGLQAMEIDEPGPAGQRGGSAEETTAKKPNGLNPLGPGALVATAQHSAPAATIPGSDLTNGANIRVEKSGIGIQGTRSNAADEDAPVNFDEGLGQAAFDGGDVELGFAEADDWA